MLDTSGTDWTSAAIGKWHLGTTAGPSGVRSVAPTLDGRSLVGVFADADATVHRRLYTEIRMPPQGPPWENVKRAARDASLKIVEIDGVRTVSRLVGFDEQAVEPDALLASEQRRVRKLERLVDRNTP